jgi:hypothetical protein
MSEKVVYASLHPDVKRMLRTILESLREGARRKKGRA